MPTQTSPSTAISIRTTPRGHSRRMAQRWAAGLAACALLAFSTPVSADDYESKEAGHPLRIVAYVVHPVGVILDYLIFRPAHFIASFEPLKTLVGHDEE